MRVESHTARTSTKPEEASQNHSRAEQNKQQITGSYRQVEEGEKQSCSFAVRSGAMRFGGAANRAASGVGQRNSNELNSRSNATDVRLRRSHCERREKAAS